jgi:hypothetical protein
MASISRLASMRSAILLRMLVDVLAGGARDLGEVLPGDRGRVLEVLTADGRHELAADEVAVAGLDRNRAVGLSGGREKCHLMYVLLLLAADEDERSYRHVAITLQRG